MFLLDTATHRLVRIGAGSETIARRQDFMAVPTSGGIVAVVDDDESILRSLEYLLESADYAVRTYTSASSLNDSDNLQHLDFLLPDILMIRLDFPLLARDP